MKKCSLSRSIQDATAVGVDGGTVSALAGDRCYRGTLLIRYTHPVEPYSSHMPRDLWFLMNEVPL